MSGMRVVIAPNSFKESLSAADVAHAMARGVLRARPDAEVICRPLADGGDGTLEVLVAATGGVFVQSPSHDPLGRPMQASFGLLGDGETAVIEMARVSGLALLKPEERDPEKTSTLGTGELIAAALGRGIKRLVIGIGGSATNDAGMGVAHALGVRFLDDSGHELEPVGGQLDKVRALRQGPLVLRQDLEVIVACDVTNPLYGDLGAAHVYAPQKGADASMVARLDRGLRIWCEVVEKALNVSLADCPGAGAAGGLGAGLVAFLKASLKPGVDMVMDAYRIDEDLLDAEIAFTGEGRVDSQTAYGKAPAKLAMRAQHHGVPVIALAGSVQQGWESLREMGVAACWSIAPGPVSLEESKARCAELLERAAEEGMRTFLAGRRER